MGFFGKMKPDGTEDVEHTQTKEKRWGEDQPLFDLNDCPKCGAKQSDGNVYTAFFGFLDEVGNGWKVLCKQCRNQSQRFYPVEQDAVKQWNEGDEK